MSRTSAFDCEAARNFILRSGSPLDQVRLSHFLGNTQDDTLWQSLNQYQNRDGGWGYGIDPDYRGAANSIHSTIAALRLIVAHSLGEHPRTAQTVRFLKQTVLPDGTWHEIQDVQTYGPPGWYRPARFRIWESGCLAGYSLALGYTELWSQAARYVREIWFEMPRADVPHPYWAVLLLLGPSSSKQDKEIVGECREQLEQFLDQDLFDPYDAIWALEAVLRQSNDADDPLIERLFHRFAQYQDRDGGVVTAYGPHLRADGTLYALMCAAAVDKLGA